jgi:thioredoxin
VRAVTVLDLPKVQKGNEPEGGRRLAADIEDRRVRPDHILDDFDLGVGGLGLPQAKLAGRLPSLPACGSAPRRLVLLQRQSMAIEVDTEGFEREVVARSADVPVVVDFWAEWCVPCRTLGPVLEREVAARDGQLVLAKVDVDANQDLAARYDVRGIPAVKAFRNGYVVSEFAGAAPPADVARFLDELTAPSEAEELIDELRAEGVCTPLRAWLPRALNRIPAPATRSTTVRDTRISPGAASSSTRAPMCTAIPAISLSRISIAPACSPARIWIPVDRVAQVDVPHRNRDRGVSGGARARLRGPCRAGSSRG